MRECGVTNEKVYNVNGGFFIVQREMIDVICDLAVDFWKYSFQHGYAFTEEPPLAYVAQMLCEDPARHLMLANSNIWCTDWTRHYKDRLPDGKTWLFKDYFTEELFPVNPAIVHLLKEKPLLISHGQDIIRERSLAA